MEYGVTQDIAPQIFLMHNQHGRMLFQQSLLP